ncbi:MULTISPECIES: oligopeptide ABC transporter permease [unclassified Brenneria]|uniref:oligopeptide ABC transporter permease n=1 Tax=unclassified Brenneria TaxID=2634434 RepID=UPI0029C11620|nr:MULTISPECIES: oligopeptide ABC transporter permease [unclassified Brenneria]MDX5630002.1 ABC transporter permease [Brenneria sp. L3-3Z]MDX5697148.1 ABC transporter permease [Brenneria sp. L4-2C]MEE3664033.1 oligopeptide ABC transporter permease [Brenneria sp. g21c3]
MSITLPAANDAASIQGNRAWRRFRRHTPGMVGLAVLALIVIVVLVAPWFMPLDPDDIDLTRIESPPSVQHWLGTDELGRDVLTRLIYGGQVSVLVAFSATLLQLGIGITLGGLAGYFGKGVDAVVMRFTDIIMCFPFYAIAISMAGLLGASTWNVVIIIGVLNWTGIARLIRAEFLSLSSQEYVEAARVMNVGHWRIISRHLLPNALGPVIVYATLAIATGILAEAALSFLGLGVKQPTASWGNMLSAAQNMRVLGNAWWLWLPPGVMVFVMVLAINFVGDALRYAFDPTSSRA